MNCKQGDLASIVKSYAGNEGKIVRCVKFSGEKRIKDINGIIRSVDCWEIDIPLRGWEGDIHNFAPDSNLRAIRDSDKQDEMLSIVNLKEKVKL